MSTKSFFISYAHEDAPAAKRLANDLRSHGHSVWIDEEQIKSGDSLVEKIQEGINSSQNLIVLLSENSAKSTWVRQEIASAFQDDPAGSARRIIPVLLDSRAEVPLSLAKLKYIDFTTAESYFEGLKALSSLAADSEAERKRAALAKLIDVPDLAKELAKEVAEILGGGSSGAPPSGGNNSWEGRDYPQDDNLVVVVISFLDEMEPIFEGIKAAGEAHGLTVERVKDVPGDYRITDKIIEMLLRARFIVADLTFERPNVYFELGFARGLGKTVITTAREGTKLHFDVKDWTCTQYNDSRVLERQLKDRFAYEIGKA